MATRVMLMDLVKELLFRMPTVGDSMGSGTAMAWMRFTIRLGKFDQVRLGLARLCDPVLCRLNLRRLVIGGKLLQLGTDLLELGKGCVAVLGGFGPAMVS